MSSQPVAPAKYARGVLVQEPVELLGEDVQETRQPIDHFEREVVVRRGEAAELVAPPHGNFAIGQGDKLHARDGCGDARDPEDLPRVGNPGIQLLTIHGCSSKSTMAADHERERDLFTLPKDRLVGSDLPKACGPGKGVGRIGTNARKARLDHCLQTGSFAWRRGAGERR